MKLNPSKLHFGVKVRKFLDYMVMKRGIEASPKIIKVVLNLQSPSSIKYVQRLTLRVAALNMFISKASKSCKPFYDVLRKNKKFEWTSEHESSFQQLKNYLYFSPIVG